MKTIHLFRAGTRRDMKGVEVAFSEATLAGIASTYDPAVHEAPIVVGHPTTNGPAWGWIANLSAAGDDLHGTPQQVEAEFAEMVESGRYKKVSASFYLPGSSTHPLGPDAEHPYLRHVGFLGAQPPSVKGLAGVEFADDEEGVVTVEFGEDTPDAPAWSVRSALRMLRRVRSWIASTSDEATAEAVLPQSELDYAIEDIAREEGAHYERQRKQPAFAEPTDPTPEDVETDAPAPETDPTTEDPMADKPTPEEREQELADRQRQLDEREAQFAEREQKARHADHVAFAEGLADDGARILPRHVPVVTAVLDRLSGGEAEVVSFGEGEEDVPLADALQQMLQELPQHVEYAELAAAERGTSPAADVKVPAGYTADADRQALHQQIVAYAEQHDVEYAVAAQRLGA